LSLPFDEHSSGFRWFFSFLAAFSEYENAQAPIVILLDEPALSLHARAQADFLRFIEERSITTIMS
jgi:predicted ATPase